MNEANRYAAVVAAGLLMSLAGSAMAQTSPADQSRSGPPGQASGGSDSPQIRAPVLRITSIEVIRSSHGPALDIIRVRGLASSGGWEEAELVPLTRGAPPDGMLELVFVARAPAEASNATGFEVVEAIFPIESNHPFKGVNVRSATESVRVKEFPGYAEGKAAGEDCAKCVGKGFV